MRQLAFLFVVALAAACSNPEDVPPDKPDAGTIVDAGTRDSGPRDGGEEDGGVRDAGPRDGGDEPAGLRLRSVNLAPATGRAASPAHQLNGRLRADGNGRATSDAYELRGGIVPGAGR